MIDTAIDPLQVQSLKEACILRLESMILSGELKIGSRLPSERALAARLAISRPVLHESLVDLELKGLVRIVARHGVFINDYRRNGSCALLSSLLSFHKGDFDPAFAHSLIDMRMTMEVECAREAAVQRTAGQLSELSDLRERESTADRSDVNLLTELDFDYHLLIAIASGNLVYPLIINSFKGVYTKLTSLFFALHAGTAVIDTVFDFHARLLDAIADQQPELAAAIMTEMLKHGERYLTGG